MARRVSSGEAQIDVPVGEVDIDVTVPDAPTAVTDPAHTIPSDPRLPQRFRSLPIAIVAAVLLVGAVAGVFVVRRATRPAVVAQPINPPAPVAKATETIVTIHTTPDGAHVFVDDEARGITPLELRLPTSDRASRLWIERSGYKSFTTSVVRERDRSMELALQPEPPPTSDPHPKGRRSPSRRPTAAPSASTKFFRFD